MIGNTPLLQLCTTGTGSRLLLKMDSFNPTGSVKVRMALEMVLGAERSGQLQPGGRIVEPTSGNTGLGLAIVASQRGYRFTAVVDHHAAKDKLDCMAALGAELVFVGSKNSDRPSTVLRRATAQRIVQEDPSAWWPDQHNNPHNPAGYAGLAHELGEQLPEGVDVLVAAVGTGGTLCGTTNSLREMGHTAETIGVEPEGSVIFGGPAGSYKQSGAGAPAGFKVGCNVRHDLIDHEIKVDDVKAFATARVLARHYGLMVGGTAGAAVYEGLRHLQDYPPHITMVVIVCDAGEKYLDTIFNDASLQTNQLHSELVERHVVGMFDAYRDSHFITRPRGGCRVSVENNKSVETVTYREVYSLALPIAGVQLAGVALTTTDALMLQTLGVVAIAGGGLAMQFYNQIRTMCVGMVTAGGNLVAEAAAEWEKTKSTSGAEKIRQAVRSCMAVGTVTALVGGLLVVALGALVLALPVDSRVAHLTFAMTLTLAPGLIPMIWLNVLRQFAVGMRRPGSLLVVTVISIAVNAGANAALLWLVHKVGWGAAWGVAGIGLSTTLVQIFTLGAFARTLRRDSELSQFFAVIPRRGDTECIRYLIRLGIPVSLTYGSEAAITTIAGLTMGLVSPAMLAAHTVVNQLAYIVYQVCIGFSHGGSVLISRARTEGRESVALVARRVLISVGIYLTAIGVVWLALGRFVVWPFLTDASPATVRIATLLLCLAVLQQFAKGSQNVLVGLLRGVKDTKSGLRATLWGYWLVGVPTLLILGLGLHWEGYGVWTGLILGFGTTALLLAKAFRQRLTELPPVADKRNAEVETVKT
ncbi:pyridoxal-phosphate dependent enzyme [Corynebacterium kroppenstedtii]|jgi:multidrug and toxic compound extrusion family protein|uniref:pyridoxal-phosphate dependent enzyme n=1 Tax=Corynebacterium kroppenstedtii TaxID=161879 RepID=UPI0034CD5C5C